ncbi:calcium-binding protein [Synechococcus sp. KORDI-100]|uniref:calcium-binding protein n=1 Tax=Synechococcus sp. KORDI-100 TaxID=1280380 RepID=UPI0012DFEF24|nr:calcium-binding protein [Synechococcus sp. KORDI-100]
MRILAAIVHHWNPEGDRRHQSLRPNPQPRIDALQRQLLGLRRLGTRQGYLDISSQVIQNANEALRLVIDPVIVHDGENHVIDYFDDKYQQDLGQHSAQPESSKYLGFCAQQYLADRLDQKYDLYVYLEDDLVIHDPLFFHKVSWFSEQVGPQAVLLPQRVEMPNEPASADRLFIDGPLPKDYLRALIPDPPPPVQTPQPGGIIQLESPLNPHAGCFALTHAQLLHWTQQPHWQDRDVSFISPLESAATLGLLKTFQVYKPALACGSWLEIQHYGNNFSCLIADDGVTILSYDPDTGVFQSPEQSQSSITKGDEAA